MSIIKTLESIEAQNEKILSTLENMKSNSRLERLKEELDRTNKRMEQAKKECLYCQERKEEMLYEYGFNYDSVYGNKVLSEVDCNLKILHAEMSRLFSEKQYLKEEIDKELQKESEKINTDNCLKTWLELTEAVKQYNYEWRAAKRRTPEDAIDLIRKYWKAL